MEAQMGIAAHIGLGQTVTFNGRTWQLSRLERRHWRDWFAWAKTQLANPLDAAIEGAQKLAQREAQIEADATIPDNVKAKMLAAIGGQQELLTREALARSGASLSFDDPQVKALLASLDGVSQLYMLLLRDKHPEATPEDGYAAVEALGLAGAQAGLDKASGTVPTQAPAA
jgi:hypothetical protein